MLLTIIGILIGGFVIGGLARLAVPGPDPMPVWMTILIGFAGSIVGGVVGQVLLGRPGGFLLALIGAVLLVIGYRRFVQHRPITGPEAHRPPR
ncbi:MAG TPA: GlsB/YeaQ/YmgE family stress response membrane protein [Gaiellaceae bacterium]